MGQETTISWCHATFNPWRGQPVRLVYCGLRNGGLGGARIGVEADRSVGVWREECLPVREGEGQ